MKPILIILTIALSLFFWKKNNNTSTQNRKMSDPSLQCLFDRPLIIGASVSAGYGTNEGDPGSVLASMFNPDAQITNKAISGAMSTEVIRGIKLSDYEPSVIMAFDLFFWNAAKGNCSDAFEKDTRDFFQEVRDLGLPIVVGKVPVGAKFPRGLRLVGQRPCTRAINKLIDELCTVKNNCIVFNPKDCINSMASETSPEGIKYFRDEIHTSDEGNKFCANYFRDEGTLTELTCVN